VFKAVLSVSEGDNGNEEVKEKEWVVEGLWHTTGKGEVFHNVSGQEEVTVREREEMKSRRLWGAVAKGIMEGYFEHANLENGRIEVYANPIIIFVSDPVCRMNKVDEEASGTI
jgi:hypothetical protein